MIVLVPMAGAGSRFSTAGYRTPKPLLPVTSRHSGERMPMVVAAVHDLPVKPDRTVFVIRDSFRALGVYERIRGWLPEALFTEVSGLTEGQASSCLLAEKHILPDDELLIASCDNGMLADPHKFAAARRDVDALIFTFRDHASVLDRPEAYSWVETDDDGHVVRVSAKQPVSNNPLRDHALTGAFWFRRGEDFLNAARAHVQADDRINNEFYVDQVMNHAIKLGLRVGVFEVDRYLGWGTPKDYHQYERTWAYWREFRDNEPLLGSSANTSMDEEAGE